MSGRAERFPWRWVLAAIGAGALIVVAFVARLPSPPPAPAASPSDQVRVVASLPASPSSVHRYDPPPAPFEWTGPARDAIVAALHLPGSARLSEVTGTQAARQVVCGEVRIASDQPLRRFTYVKAAKLGAIDDGGAEFAQAYAQLCGR